MTKEFLNPSLKPYNALTREEKHILLDAVFDNNCEAYDIGVEEWDDKTNSEFFNTSIYRTKPKEYKKLNVPWEFIDDYWKYAVMDNGGCLYFYATQPEWVASAGIWSCNQPYRSTNVLKLDTTGIVAEHSLTERPKGE